MHRAIQTTKILALFVLYAWLCQEFYLFHVMDACLDGGGVYDSAARACTSSRFGENWDVGARAAFLFWPLLLGLPALVVLAVSKVLSYVIRKLGLVPPNSTVETDARRSGVRGSP
jgi:hypothetical protein